MRVGIIGAGLSGLVAARTLRQEGHDVLVVEKSRGVGGRLAARRVVGTVVDHGAPIIDAPTGSSLARLLTELAVDDHVDMPEGVAYRAGATRLAKALAADLNVVLGVRIAAIRTTRDGRFELAGEQGNTHGDVDAVIVSAPAPQAADVLENSRESGERVAALRAITYDPAIMILAGMAIAAPTALDPFTVADPFVRITAESVKGRDPIDGVVPIVARVSPGRSTGYLDASDDDILTDIVPVLREVCAADADPIWVQVKRWRYATCATTTDFDVLNPSNSRVIVCGDATVGVDLTGVCDSGIRAARRVMA